MGDEIRALSPRAWAALALILALGLLFAVSAFARPLHPAAQQAPTQGEQKSQPSETVDPRC